MFLKSAEDQVVPAWACFFSAAEYREFIHRVALYFKNREIAYHPGEGAVCRTSHGGHGLEKMGLLNLAQHCRLRPPAEWNKLITSHFDGIRKAAGFESGFSAKAHDFDFVKHAIAVRVYPREYVAAIEDGLVIGQLVTDDIYAMLVFDFPDCIVNIRPEQTIQWGLTNEELFELGLENIRKKYPLDISKQLLDGVSFHLVIHDHFYSPNVLLMLEKILAEPPVHGFLVGVPNRHAVLLHPITGSKVLPAIHRMIPAVAGMYRDGPGSISEKLYWFSGGEFIPLPYTIDAENINLNPPPGFLELLNRLKPGTDSSGQPSLPAWY